MIINNILDLRRKRNDNLKFSRWVCFPESRPEIRSHLCSPQWSKWTGLNWDPLVTSMISWFNCLCSCLNLLIYFGCCCLMISGLIELRRIFVSSGWIIVQHFVLHEQNETFKRNLFTGFGATWDHWRAFRDTTWSCDRVELQEPTWTWRNRTCL